MKQADNTKLFSGFADVYDRSRPRCPEKLIEFLLRYLGRSPELVADIGCGTGLSTMLWGNYAREVVGIEPNQDMIRFAEGKLGGKSNIRFIRNRESKTGLADSSVDIITCVQSFHWFEQELAFEEFQRILKSGGILAILDNDFPPVSFLQADRAYNRLLEVEAEMEQKYPELKESYIKADKYKYLKILKECGRFSYVREIVFCNTEECDAARYIDLAFSQSPLQRIINAGIQEMTPHLDSFKQEVEQAFRAGRAKIDFCYRLRLAVK